MSSTYPQRALLMAAAFTLWALVLATNTQVAHAQSGNAADEIDVDADAGQDAGNPAASLQATASDPSPTQDQSASQEPAPCPHEPAPSEGTGVASASGDLVLLDPSSASSRQIAPGFTVQIVGKRTRWPAMIGLGGGIMSFGSSTENGPFFVAGDGAGGIYGGSTQIVRDLELRHAEIVMRVQPFWKLVRPFVEGSFGLGVLWRGAKLEDANGNTLASDDRQKTASYITGFAAGIDWRLGRAPAPGPSWSFVLSTGVRRWYTGPMEVPVYRQQDNQLHTDSAHPHLAMWIPFVAIGLAIDSRPAPCH